MTEETVPVTEDEKGENGRVDLHQCRELTDIETGQLAYLGEVIHWIGGDEDAASETLLDKLAVGALRARGISDANGEPQDILADYFGPAFSHLRYISRLDDRLVSHHGGVVVLNHEDAPFATWKSWKAVGVEVSTALALWERKGPSEKPPRQHYDHHQLVAYLEEKARLFLADKGPRVTSDDWRKVVGQERFPGVSTTQCDKAWGSAKLPPSWRVRGRQKKA